MHNAPINLSDYTYDLPDEKIARFPLANRDQAKLLVYRQSTIQDRVFVDLPTLLPTHSSLFFNDTKVIPARLYFQKTTGQHAGGATIEVFLLHPEQPSRVMSQAMQATRHCSWHCVIGNQKRWKPGTVLQKTVVIAGQPVTLQATWADRERKIVSFHWEASAAGPPVTFADIIEASGQVPLPPYLKRTVSEEDKPRYQTVYSRQQGAVAAPTAGLHFTDEVLTALRQQGIGLHYLTLHVSAGTFQPIKEENIREHPMHSEQIVVTRENLRSLLEPDKPVVAVGTTSLRTLESLYWLGVQIIKEQNTRFFISKLSPYQYREEALPTMQEAMSAVLDHMQLSQQETLVGETEIFIFPGYTFKVCQGLITNFHMPQSTLILLIAAFIGEDWRKVYRHALQHPYRFLSYGDTSLLWRQCF